MKKALRLLGFAGMAVGVLAYPAAFAVDRAAGEDVILVSPRDEAAVAIERFNWESDGSPKDPVLVATIYGSPFEKGVPKRIVCPRADALLHPGEAPEVTLFLKKDDENPLQAQTLWYFALVATVGGIVTGAVLLWLAGRMKVAAAPAA